jgi:hypothetical protein
MESLILGVSTGSELEISGDSLLLQQTRLLVSHEKTQKNNRDFLFIVPSFPYPL